IACTVSAPHGDIEIPMPARGHLYRIAREAVHNAAKHAQARSITLSVEPTTIVVSDDGIGIAPHSNAGMGLRLMESRAKMTGAVLRVEGTPKGTIVTCSVPA
ncbi:MAG TPA: ATP-binding protein, partial [Kofleriaceae bacterium]